MNRFALTAILCLLAGLAHGTFELQDPAQQVIEDLTNEAGAGQAPRTDAEFLFVDQQGRSAGDLSCGDYVASRQEQSDWYWPSLFWLQGFINGAAYRQSGKPGVSFQSPDQDTESMALWIENHCRDHPQDDLAGAAAAFVDD